MKTYGLLLTVPELHAIFAREALKRHPEVWVKDTEVAVNLTWAFENDSLKELRVEATVLDVEDEHGKNGNTIQSD